MPPEEASIARVRDGGKLSALGPCPATEVTAERFEVFRVVLPAGEDDSGYVGWLASRIKARTGSGLFVICGYDRERGGVFDYYGIPAEAADDVRQLLAATPRADSLDGIVMAARSVAAGSALGPDTIFCFDQQHGVLSARYGGGNVRDSWLAGTLDAPLRSFDFDYLQIGSDGRIDTGHSRAELGKTAAARWTLTEHFAWSSRAGSGTNY